MGEPAVPTTQERIERRALASSVVEAVRNDEECPKLFTDAVVFGLSQEIEMLVKERDEWMRRAASHGCDTDKGDIDCG